MNEDKRINFFSEAEDSVDMTLGTLMKGYTPNKKYSGIITADDIVFAINDKPNTQILSEGKAEDKFIVGQLGATGIESELNPETQESIYIRAGKSTVKTGTQRTFTYSADRYVGDPFQDFCISLRYKTGQDVITDYVYFNLKTGLGEMGKCSVIVQSDGSGTAGSNATVSIMFNKVGDMPKEYDWTASHAG